MENQTERGKEEIGVIKRVIQRWGGREREIKGDERWTVINRGMQRWRGIKGERPRERNKGR